MDGTSIKRTSHRSTSDRPNDRLRGRDDDGPIERSSRRGRRRPQADEAESYRDCDDTLVQKSCQRSRRRHRTPEDDSRGRQEDAPVEKPARRSRRRLRTHEDDSRDAGYDSRDDSRGKQPKQQTRHSFHQDEELDSDRGRCHKRKADESKSSARSEVAQNRDRRRARSPIDEGDHDECMQDNYAGNGELEHSAKRRQRKFQESGERPRRREAPEEIQRDDRLDRVGREPEQSEQTEGGQGSRQRSSKDLAIRSGSRDRRRKKRTSPCIREEDSVGGGNGNGSDLAKTEKEAKPEKEATAIAMENEKPRERVSGFSGDVYSGRLPNHIAANQASTPRSYYAAQTGAAASREHQARNLLPTATGGRDVPPGCCIFVGHLPPGVTEALVVQTFQIFGPLVAVKIFGQEGYCLAQFTSPLDAQVAVNMTHKKVWLGETLNVKISHHPYVRL